MISIPYPEQWGGPQFPQQQPPEEPRRKERQDPEIEALRKCFEEQKPRGKIGKTQDKTKERDSLAGE